MNAHRISPALRVCAALMLATACAAGPAWAAGTAAADAQARYQQERAVCTSGQSNQDRTTCLKEAGAAYAEARRGTPASDPAAQAANQSQRCAALPDGDRQACLARMQGKGSTSGSVAAGGISRDLVTRDGVPQVK